MVLYEYAALQAGGQCGASGENPGSCQCISIAKCDKDIRSHLRSFGAGFVDLTVKTEAGLARAGMHLHNDLLKCKCGRLFAQASASQCKCVY